MDGFHRKSQGHDTRNHRDCQFCNQMDPDFFRRRPMDRLVQSKLDDIASAHLTEDGYVRHRIAELMKLRTTHPSAFELKRSA